MATLRLGNCTLSGTDDEVIKMYATITKRFAAGEPMTGEMKVNGGERYIYFGPSTPLEADFDRPLTDEEKTMLSLSGESGLKPGDSLSFGRD